jgi:hypothetical protein
VVAQLILSESVKSWKADTFIFDKVISRYYIRRKGYCWSLNILISQRNYVLFSKSWANRCWWSI